MTLENLKPEVGGHQAGTANHTLGRPTQSTAEARAAARLTEVIVGKPTVSGNAGTQPNEYLLRAFDAASIADAEFLRLPSPRARCRLSGLSRTGLNELIEAGRIRAIKVRKPGAQRGVVLIVKNSLVDYLRGLDAEQNGKPATEEGGER